MSVLFISKMTSNDKSIPFELVQYYFNLILQSSDSDRREIEDRGQQYISTLKAARDKLLSAIGFAITILLALAAMNFMQQILIAASFVLIAVGIGSFFVVDILIRRCSIIFLKIKAARYKPILTLMQILDNYVTLTLEVSITIEHLRVFLKYLRLVSALKIELIEEFKKASTAHGLLSEKAYYNSLRETEELLLSQALDYYLNNKDELEKDELIQIYEAILARTMGGETVLQRYERLTGTRTAPVVYEDQSHGVKFIFPSDWKLSTVSSKQKKIESLEKTVIVSNPIREGNNVTLRVSTLDYDTLSNKPKSFQEVVDLNLSLLRDDADISILENDSIKIGEFSGHKTIYTINYKGLVDKVMNLWFEINNTVFQFSFQASNTELFTLYYDKCIQIINNIKMTK